jgi:hypothetical protein
METKITDRSTDRGLSSASRAIAVSSSSLSGLLLGSISVSLSSRTQL